MINIRQILTFMGMNIISTTMFVSMFGDVSGICVSIGAAVILSQMSLGDYT